MRCAQHTRITTLLTRCRVILARMVLLLLRPRLRPRIVVNVGRSAIGCRISRAKQALAGCLPGCENRAIYGKRKLPLSYRNRRPRPSVLYIVRVLHVFWTAAAAALGRIPNAISSRHTLAVCRDSFHPPPSSGENIYHFPIQVGGCYSNMMTQRWSCK